MKPGFATQLVNAVIILEITLCPVSDYALACQDCDDGFVTVSEGASGCCHQDAGHDSCHFGKPHDGPPPLHDHSSPGHPSSGSHQDCACDGAVVVCISEASTIDQDPPLESVENDGTATSQIRSARNGAYGSLATASELPLFQLNCSLLL